MTNFIGLFSSNKPIRRKTFSLINTKKQIPNYTDKEGRVPIVFDLKEQNLGA